jgi:hypothetical protein
MDYDSCWIEQRAKVLAKGHPIELMDLLMGYLCIADIDEH